MNKIFSGLLWVAITLVSVNPGWAAENAIAFQFAPAPITNEGLDSEAENRFSGQYISYNNSAAKFELTGYGVGYASRTMTDGSGSTFVDSLTFMSGEGTSVVSTEVKGFSGNMAYTKDWRMDSFGGLQFSIGGKAEWTTLTMTGAFRNTSFESKTNILGLGLLSVLQYHWHVSPGITVTPYSMFTFTNMTASTDAGSSNNESSFNSTATIFGLDVVLFDGISVAGMVQSSQDDDLAVINVGWNF